MSVRTKILLILSAAGILVSAYLVNKTIDPTGIACGSGGCETVLTSSWAKIGGIPVAAFGLAWYTICIFLIWRIWFRKDLSYFHWQVWMVLGLAFSLYLLALEAFVIHAYCRWCLGSLAIIILMCYLTLVRNKQEKKL